jgi:hypothetical protein
VRAYETLHDDDQARLLHQKLVPSKEGDIPEQVFWSNSVKTSL